MFWGDAKQQEAQRKAYNRAKAEGKRTWALAGWKTCYQIAMKERWFEVLGKTPYEAVFRGDFEQMAYFMTVYNAMK